MKNVFADLFFELIGKIILSLLCALACFAALLLLPYDVFWNGEFLGCCITLASILCAYEGIHQSVLVSCNSKFACSVLSGRYKNTFSILSMMPLLVSLAFIIYSLVLFVCTCTDDNKLVLMKDFSLVFVLWCFLFFAMISIFIHIHYFCLRIVSEDNT